MYIWYTVMGVQENNICAKHILIKLLCLSRGVAQNASWEMMELMSKVLFEPFWQFKGCDHNFTMFFQPLFERMGGRGVTPR